MTFGLMDLTKDFIKGEIDRAEPEVVQARLAICNACENLSALRACKLCGCFMDAKVKFSKSSCPINKWGPSK